MCGIAGIWNSSDKLEKATLDRFTDSLAHRGPDQRGTEMFMDGRMGLGHRRLAILDPSKAGRQPMSYLGGRYWISYNGEIYNYIELREELAGLGYTFRSQTDTEVVLAAYTQWGADALLKFNGMWAFAIWDQQERELFLSRDRFGIKPLYYQNAASDFYFASEIKAFLHLDCRAHEINYTAIDSTLRNPFSLNATGQSLIKGVLALPAGHLMRVRNGKATISRWWDTRDHLSSAPDSFEDQVEVFRELFDDACRIRMRSDVAVGTSLSGGLDSGSILCSLAAAREGTDNDRKPHMAFVSSFPGTATDELAAANRVADSSGTPRIAVMPETTMSDSLIRKVIYDFEDIYITLPLPAWQIYQAQRANGIVVSLDGHGADESLAGYRHHGPAALAGSSGLLRAPHRAIDLVNTVHRLQVARPGTPMLSRFEIAKQSEPFTRRAVETLLSVYGRGLPPRIEPAQDDDWLELSPDPAAGELSPAGASSAPSMTPLNELLYDEFHETILPTILRNFDRCSMAHGVEVRMPFMDWRLVCLAFSLPDASKIGAGFSKRVLREAMTGRLPESIRVNPRKIGFNSPLPEWFEGSLGDWAMDELSSRAFQECDLWKARKIRDFAEKRHRDGKWSWSDCERIWPFLHASLWLQLFGKSCRNN
jgi:asparagine synthase (glutamine-hydrolysing)